MTHLWLLFFAGIIIFKNESLVVSKKNPSWFISELKENLIKPWHGTYLNLQVLFYFSLLMIP